MAKPNLNHILYGWICPVVTVALLAWFVLAPLLGWWGMPVLLIAVPAVIMFWDGVGELVESRRTRP